MSFLNDNLPIHSYHLGENGHLELKWSQNIREKILQWNFQAIRCSEEKMIQLELIYYQLIKQLFTIYNFSCIEYYEKQIAMDHLVLLYKMIGQMRDFIHGKGEYTISFHMIYSWYQFCPELSFFAIENFVKRNDHEQPFGSWKDIKYFCNFLIKKGITKNHDIIHFCIQLINNQLREDEIKNKSNQSISLVAKWIPRENSEKFGWLNELLAVDYFSFYLKDCSEQNKIQFERATNKCKMDYRKLISKLNKICETIEIKQCSKNWANISFHNITSIGFLKKSASFLNNKNKKEIDRKICEINFKYFIEQNIEKNGCKIKGKYINLGDFTKRALFLLELNELNPEDENIIFQMKILNEQWKDNSNNTEILGNMIPIVDISETNTDEGRNLAIAIGIRIAEKTIFAKRIIIFGSYSRWINLDSCNNFTSMVNKIKQKDWGINADFYSSLNFILNEMINVKMSSDEIKKLMLIIISDMQIDSFKENKNNLYLEIKQLYQTFGFKYFGKDLEPPVILFWNVRNTNGFPASSTQKNCFMFSGNHTFLLNSIGESNKKTSLCIITPWDILIKSLENHRYKILETKIVELI